MAISTNAVTAQNRSVYFGWPTLK